MHGRKTFATAQIGMLTGPIRFVPGWVSDANIKRWFRAVHIHATVDGPSRNVFLLFLKLEERAWKILVASFLIPVTRLMRNRA